MMNLARMVLCAMATVLSLPVLSISAAFAQDGQRAVLVTGASTGIGKRVMFGSDQMVWPETIARSIDVINEAPFLSNAEKRDILFWNAARFLRLSEAEIERMHNPPD